MPPYANRYLAGYLCAVFCLLVVSCNDGYAEIRYSYPYEVQILKDGSSPRYAGQERVTSNDIIIFGSDVTIDEPLLSNGGDVVIFAETLHVNAPIDTRMYLNHKSKMFPKGDGACKSIEEWLKGAPTALESFELLYTLTDDVWDKESKAYVLAQKEVFPEVPSGLTKCAEHGKISESGELDASSIIWPSLKSGNITIAVNKVIFCSSCGKNSSTWDGRKPEIPERNETRFDEKTFFNARGLRGSRGSMPVWGCEASTTVDSACKNLALDKTRVPGSSGGDAGQIEFHIINNPEWLLQNKGELLDRSSSVGGQGGSTEPLLSPCFARTSEPRPCVKIPRHASRLTFPVGSPTKLDTLAAWRPDGKGAIPQFHAVQSASAVSTLSSLLIAMESNKARSYKQFLLSSGDTKSVLNYVSPLDHLTAFLRSAKIEVNIAAINSLERSAAFAAGPPRYSSLFSKLDISPAANAGVHNEAYSMVLQLAPFNKFRTSANLVNFSTDIGGVFNFSVYDAVNRVLNQKTNVALGKVRSAIQDTTDTIWDFQQNTFEYTKLKFQADFKQRLSDLTMRIREAEDQARRIEAFAKVASNFNNLLSGALSLYSDFETGNYLAMANRLSGMIQNVAIIDEAVRFTQQAARLREVYADVVGDLNDTINRLNEIKRAMYEKRDEKMKTLIDSRNDFDRIYSETLSYNDDLARLAIVNYLQNGNRVDLEFNVLQLRALNTKYPDFNIDLSRLNQMQPVCGSISPRPIREVLASEADSFPVCAITEPDQDRKKWSELFVKSGEWQGVVLHRFPPTARPRKIELFGLFLGKELDWRYVSD